MSSYLSTTSFQVRNMKYKDNQILSGYYSYMVKRLVINAQTKIHPTTIYKGCY